MNIRLEHESDYKICENITREAFWNLYRPGANEHFIVHNMRNHPDFIPELSFVIEKNSEIAGCIYYTKSKIVSDNGMEHSVITFGPVAILPKYHRQGLGRALITHSVERAKALGYTAILIGGFPYHYHCYGFVGAKQYGITLPDGKYYTGIMALPLYDGALHNISGSLYFSDVYEPSEEESALYDKDYPYKAKAILPCQADFERAASEIDE